jgi:VAD1 Analog of StAR-related lipid transfer domain
LQVPFGDAFYQDIQFLGTAASAGSASCRLRVSAEVKFTRRVLGMGGLIQKSATKVGHAEGPHAQASECHWRLPASVIDVSCGNLRQHG